MGVIFKFGFFLNKKALTYAQWEEKFITRFLSINAEAEAMAALTKIMHGADQLDYFNAKFNALMIEANITDNIALRSILLRTVLLTFSTWPHPYLINDSSTFPHYANLHCSIHIRLPQSVSCPSKLLFSILRCTAPVHSPYYIGFPHSHNLIVYKPLWLDVLSLDCPLVVFP